MTTFFENKTCVCASCHFHMLLTKQTVIRNSEKFFSYQFDARVTCEPLTGLPRSGEKDLENEIFPGQGKVREFC